MSRMFRTFTEAQHEIRRELAERSIEVQPETMQDKIVADNIDFLTKEIQNFQYTVTQPDLADLSPWISHPWVEHEFGERISVAGMNPGRAYMYRPEVWNEFLEEDGRFAYSYPERIGTQVEGIIDELRLHPNSRQLYLAIWDRAKDPSRRGKRRVPCSLGYYFLNRQGRLDITYMMRSCDFHTHWANDVYLARRLQEYVAARTNIQPGLFSQIVMSLHVYAKDVAEVF